MLSSDKVPALRSPPVADVGVWIAGLTQSEKFNIIAHMNLYLHTTCANITKAIRFAFLPFAFSGVRYRA
jgi:hypothetical protein